MFGRTPHSDLNPDEVVALGAAVQADILVSGRREMLLLDGATVDPTARVSGGTTVGRNVTIGKGARVEGSILLDGAVVEDEARVMYTVVGHDARIGAGAVVHETVVGDRAVVGGHCELRRGVRVWPDVVLPPHGVRFSPDV